MEKANPSCSSFWVCTVLTVIFVGLIAGAAAAYSADPRFESNSVKTKTIKEM